MIHQKFSYIKLAIRGFAYHIKSNALLAIGCAAACMVLTGALLIGDSLDSSLRRLHDDRIGNVEWVLQMPSGGFGARIADVLGDSFETNAAPIFSRVGSLGVRGTNERVHRVNIIGVDENFWKLGPQNTRAQNINDNEVVINKSLAEKLNVNVGDNVILRFQNAASLTMEAPFGLQENLSTHNLTVANIIDKNDFGDFNLQAQHFTVYNAFVSLNFMQFANDMQDKANAILIGKSAIADEDDIINAMRDSLHINDVGLNVRELDSMGRFENKDIYFVKVHEIYSDRMFISDEIKNKIVDVIPNATPVSSWFVNSIRKQNSDSVTPYSFVSSMPLADNSMNNSMNDDYIILSQWTADDLNAKIGDTIVLTYFVPRQTSGLRTDSAAFVVLLVWNDRNVIPPSWLNRSLAPPYPGLAGSESCTDWNPSIPIDLDKIRAKDEEFWSEHEATPKAIISYNRAAKIWDNRFGVTTAIRVEGSNHNDIESALRLSDLTPILRSMGMQITNVRNSTNTAINNGIDFAPLFLGLSFFTLIASFLFIWLMTILHLKSRNYELKTFNALGYSSKQILFIYLTEGVFIFFIGTIIGAILAPLYTSILINALRGIWFAAAPLPHLQLAVKFSTILIGGAISFICALIFMYLPMRSISKKIPSSKIYNDNKTVSAQTFTASKLIIRNIKRERKRSTFEIAILACAVLILGITQLFQKQPLRDPYIRNSGTGGFYFYAETDFAIPHEKTTAAFLRERGLNIGDDEFISVPMRKKDGDDASCLNLNQTSAPTIFGVNQNILDSLGAFNFASIINAAYKNNPWKILNVSAQNENVIYGVADANTITWGLGKNIGDMLTFTNELGDTLAIILAAALENSILQGGIIIAEENFIKHFPSISGYRTMLISPPQNLVREVAEIFETYHQLHGLQLTPTIERLNAFNAVENTYLSIFAILGMFGLALGCASLGVVVAQDIVERKDEFKTLAAIGFNKSMIRKMLFIEHAAVAVIGISIGLIFAFIVRLISPYFM